jgi:hypothetical protein
MAFDRVPPRRVVVGNGADGKSKVIFDSRNPHQHALGVGFQERSGRCQRILRAAKAN